MKQVFENSPLFEKLPNGDIQCHCCQHECTIQPGKLGRCRVRGNIDGQPYSPILGRYTVAVDPIEKKPLYHFFPGSKVYSYGTVGCNFNCQFCQNSSLSMWKCNIEDVRAIKRSDEGVLDYYTPQQMVDQALRKKCISIASTYNEPTVSSEFSFEVFRLAKQKGLHTVYVTNGFESVETLNYLCTYLDAVNIDLKAFNDVWYQKICGARFEGVCKTIERCYKMGIHTEVTTLVIPGENDSEEELTGIANFLVNISPDIVWHLSAYHDDYKFHGRGQTPLSTLRRARDIGIRAGLKYVYMGNVVCNDSGTTYCPKCKKLLVDRDFYAAQVNMYNGKCSCGEIIPGVWDGGINLPPKLDRVPDELLNKPLEPINQIPSHAILFSSKGGTSKHIAEEIAQHLGVPVLDLATIRYNDLKQMQYIVFSVSTYGRGAPAPSAKPFWDELSNHPDDGSLSHLHFAVLGCGSSSFSDTFMGFAKALETKLMDLGAQEFAPLCPRDDAEDDQTNVVNWIQNLSFS